MSLLILQGPHAPVDAAAWVSTAARAGHSTELIRCADVAGLIAGLGSARPADTALVLLDAGATTRTADQAQCVALRQALDRLPAPYIELHDDAAEELEPQLHPHHLPIATIITSGDRLRAYALSLAIAARRLGDMAAH